MMVHPLANIIRIVSFALASVPQRGPMLENQLACLSGREGRNV